MLSVLALSYFSLSSDFSDRLLLLYLLALLDDCDWDFSFPFIFGSVLCLFSVSMEFRCSWLLFFTRIGIKFNYLCRDLGLYLSRSLDRCFESVLSVIVLLCLELLCLCLEEDDDDDELIIIPIFSKKKKGLFSESASGSMGKKITDLDDADDHVYSPFIQDGKLQ